jgi:hypothetical protein
VCTTCQGKFKSQNNLQKHFLKCAAQNAAQLAANSNARIILTKITKYEKTSLDIIK